MHKNFLHPFMNGFYQPRHKVFSAISNNRKQLFQLVHEYFVKNNKQIIRPFSTSVPTQMSNTKAGSVLVRTKILSISWYLSFYFDGISKVELR